MTLKRTLLAIVLTFIVIGTGCGTTIARKDVNAKDSNITTNFIEFKKPFNKNWTFRTSYIPFEGEQANVGELTTTEIENPSPSQEPLQFEVFDIGGVRLSSPTTPGTNYLGLQYDASLLDISLEQSLAFLKPVDIRYAFGARLEKIKFIMDESIRPKLTHFGHEEFVPTFELNWHYAIGNRLSAMIFANYSGVPGNNSSSKMQGAQLECRITKNIAVTARAFNHTFKTESGLYSSDLHIRSRASALGLTIYY